MLIETVLAVVAVLLYFFFITTKRPHGFPPGPTGWPIVGYLPFVKVNPQEVFNELARKYGNIIGMRFGSKWVVVLNDHESIKCAFKEEAFSGRPSSDLTLAWTNGKKNGLILSEGRTWQELRRFTMRQLREFGFGRRTMEELIHEEVLNVIDTFRKEVGETIDLRFRFHMAVINSLWCITTGEKFRCEDPEMKALFESSFTVFEGDDMTLQTDIFYPWIVKLWPSLYHVNDLKQLSLKSQQVCRKAVHDHKKSLIVENPRDFIDVYLEKIQSETDVDSSFYGENGESTLVLVLSDLLQAGSETTSSTLYWSFLFMIRDQNVQKKIQKEIDDVVGRSRLPSLEDKPRMPYTEAVISETLRHEALAPLGLFHETTEDTVLKGFQIPKNTVVIPNMYAAQYDSKHWDKPEEFRAERFLLPDGKFNVHESQIAFSNGKRACLGEALARSELFLFITGLLQSFSFSSPEGQVTTLTPNMTFARHAKTYQVIIQER